MKQFVLFGLLFSFEALSAELLLKISDGFPTEPIEGRLVLSEEIKQKVLADQMSIFCQILNGEVVTYISLSGNRYYRKVEKFEHVPIFDLRIVVYDREASAELAHASYKYESLGEIDLNSKLSLPKKTAAHVRLASAKFVEVGPESRYLRDLPELVLHDSEELSSDESYGKCEIRSRYVPES